MGQAYSTDSPLVNHHKPLTTTEATREGEHVLSHLQTSRQKALASLFLCATEEYKKSNEHLVKESIIDDDINNCDAILSSIAAARFTVSDAIDCFPHKKAQADEDDTVINGSDVGVLGVFSSITLSRAAELSIELGDQRVLMYALCTGRVFIDDITRKNYGYYFQLENLGHRGDLSAVRFVDHFARTNDVESVIKIGLRGKENSLKYIERCAAINVARGFGGQTAQRGPNGTIYFENEPLARTTPYGPGGMQLSENTTVTTALAVYLMNIAICTSSSSDTLDGNNRNRFYSPNSKSYLSSQRVYQGNVGRGVAAREIFQRSTDIETERFCGLPLTPAQVLPLLPRLWKLLPELTTGEAPLHQRAKEQAWVNSWIRSPPLEIATAQKHEMTAYRGLVVTGDSNDAKFTIVERLTGYPVEYFLFSSTNDEIAAKILAATGSIFEVPEAYTRHPTFSPERLRAAAHQQITKKRFLRRFLLREHPLAPINDEHDRILRLTTTTRIGQLFLPATHPYNTAIARICAAARLRHMTSTSSSSSSTNNLQATDLLIHCSNFVREIEPVIGIDQNNKSPAVVLDVFSDKHDNIPRTQQVLPEEIYTTQHLTFFRSEHRVAQGQPCFSSPQAFAQKWSKFSHGILDGFESPYAWVIGGAVVSCLDPSIPDADALPSSANRDLDIAFPGLTTIGVQRQIQKLDAFLRSKFFNAAKGGNNNDHKMLTCATSTTLTYVLPYPLPRIQVMLGRWPSIGDLLSCNDIDASGVALQLFTPSSDDHDDNDESTDENNRRHNVVCTPRSLLAWIYKLSFVSDAAHRDRGSPHYELRLVKYARRHGFAVLHPHISAVDDDVYSRLVQLDHDQQSGKREKIRMTLSSGVTWLYFVDKGAFKPKLDVPSALDVSPTRGMKEVRAQIIENDYVESDNYGGTEQGYYIVNSRDTALWSTPQMEAKFLHETIDSPIWKNDLANGGNTTMEFFCPKTRLGFPSDSNGNYVYPVRGTAAESAKRIVALWGLQINHEKYRENEDWLCNLNQDETEQTAEENGDNDNNYEEEENDQNNENDDE